jgi:AmmeMemoRadiSam system protein A
MKHHPVVQLAIDTIESYIKNGTVIRPSITDPVMNERAGVFVSLKKAGMLRGCIGTFMPTKESVAQEVVMHAIQSATQDPRFPPVRSDELDQLEYSVDILTAPEPVNDRSELDPKKYGIVVESGFRRGLLLPDLDGVNTVDEQISICRMKAGISESEPVKLYRFEVRRFK